MNPNQQAAAAGQPAPAAGQPAPQPQFALAPGLVDIGLPINFGSRVGASLYHAGSLSLPIKFDGEPDNVSVFTDALMARSREMGWTNAQASIISVPVTRDGQVVNFNLIEEFGRFTLEELRTHVLTYYNQPSRTAQNANMMYYCIINTITEDANSRIINEEARYVINGINSGPLLFKFLMNVVTIDTRATITNLRMDLSSLDSYIGVVQFNIDKFNLYVKEKTKQLRNRGETSQDVLVNLFKAYEMVPDTTFNNWLIRKKENYEEGSDLNSDSLMLDALNRYQSLVREGKWQSESPDSKKIIALTAQIDQMQKLLKGTKFKLHKNSKNSTYPSGNHKKNSAPKQKSKKEMEAWKRIPPKEGESHSKKVKGKDFNWCAEHMAWGRHTEVDCELKKKRLAQERSDSTSNNQPMVSNSVTIDNQSFLDSMAAILSSE
jgi:hypothetical protein